MVISCAEILLRKEAEPDGAGTPPLVEDGQDVSGDWNSLMLQC